MVSRESRKDTVLGRIPKEISDTWKVQFPGVNNADMIRMTWNTSIINADAKIRNALGIPVGYKKNEKNK